MPLTMIVTNAGRAALVNAQNNGTAPVTIAQIGLSSTAVVPVATATALAGEFKRVSTLSGTVTAADTIHVTMTDESADAYSLRSIGLYLDTGVLFAVYGQAASILDKTASSIAALSVDVIFADINATNLTFGNANFTNPVATTDRQGVVELATVAEAQAGVDALRALTPAGAKAAILGWLLAQDGAGSGLDADLLDGQQGSWYADIAARLGYSPLNRAGDTMTGLLTLSGAPVANLHPATKQYVDGLVTAAAMIAKILTVDGAGSGLDADLLRGLSPDQVVSSARVLAALGYTPLNQTSYTAADILAKLIAVDGAGSGLDADLLDGWHRDSIRDWNNLLNKPFNWAGQAGQPQWLWGSNDGVNHYVWNPTNFSVNYAASAGNANNAGYAGSAGNADTVDGYHAADFVMGSILTGLLQGNGYMKLPPIMDNGTQRQPIVQWGTEYPYLYGGNNYTFSFPIAFPNACLAPMFSLIDSTRSYAQTHLALASWANYSCTVRAINDDSGSTSITGFTWVAIGF